MNVTTENTCLRKIREQHNDRNVVVTFGNPLIEDVSIMHSLQRFIVMHGKHWEDGGSTNLAHVCITEQPTNVIAATRHPMCCLRAHPAVSA
jgi:hypothetical protein